MNTRIIVMIFGLFFSSIAVAGGNTGFYIGAGLGQSKTSLSSPLSKDSDTAYSLIGGYNINPNLAAELEYVNLGKIDSTSTVSAKSDGMSVTAVGVIPLDGNVSLFGKFGLAKVNTSWNIAPGINVSESQSKTGLTFGVGGQLDFSPKSGVRLSYDRYQVGDNDPVTGHSNALTVAFLFRL